MPGPAEGRGPMLRILIATCLLGLSASAGLASGLVLVIANGDHETLRDATEATAVLPAARRFEVMGFEAEQASDLSAPAIRAALDALSVRIEAERPPRVVLVFAGYTLHGDRGSWLMGAETGQPGLTNVDATGVRLETLLDIASQIQGGAVVAVADLGFPAQPGTGLRPGLGEALIVPQGVSLIRGPVAQVQAVLERLAQPGTNLGAAVAETRQVRLEGFNPPYLTFLPEGYEPAADIDRTAWLEAEAEGTLVAFRAYLDEFPQGRFTDEVRAGIERLENTPERVEEALELTRDERRAIQRHLTLLGFNPRGIDGIFGAGTRGAVSGWQGREGLAQTGYLNRDQIFTLAAQAARRAAELEEEARQRQAEQERQDRAFWRDTGAGQDETGLRAYLGRFPDGIFSGIARERLELIEAERRQAAQARDRAGWDVALAADTVESYQAYLREFPQGAFAEQAAARVAELTSPPPSAEPEPDLDAARAVEAGLALPMVTRLLIEQRLAGSGYEPGAVDGEFDEDTRRAIRRFQRANGMEASGYLTQDAVARLMMGGLLQLFE